ncbi:hypothetical protein FDC70_18080 [Clostridium botulinum]|nr:hypothetical protein [Clostridium botulinum]
MKSEVLQVRLTKEDKQLFKEVATELGISMSELMIVATENIAKKHKEKMSLQESITDRAMRTDEKLAEITERIRGNKKSSKSRRFMFWVW